MSEVKRRSRYVRHISEFESGMSFRYDVRAERNRLYGDFPGRQWKDEAGSFWTITASVVGGKEILLPGLNSREAALGHFAIFSVFENPRSREILKMEEAFIMPRTGAMQANPGYYATSAVQEGFSTTLLVENENGSSVYDRRSIAARNVRPGSLRIQPFEL